MKKQVTQIYWRENIGQICVLLSPTEYVIKDQSIMFKFAMNKDEVIDIFTSTNNGLFVRCMIRTDRKYKANEEIKYETLLSAKKH